ncbi:MAG: hypothetical protein JJT82_01915 [Legionellaceae bacterium]|nr:hypothetical protein [Legionellaceae bacterium]
MHRLCFHHNIPIPSIGLLLFFMLLLCLSSTGLAVRPFVTDDARIVDYGQFEMENWLEVTRAEGEFGPAPGINIMAGVTVSDALEILLGWGAGRDPNDSATLANPVITGKLLLRKTLPNGEPGYAISLASALNQGRGSMYDEGRVYNVIGMASWRLLEDRLNLHVNLGLRHDGDGEHHFRTRPYWGLGAEAATAYPRLHFVIEAFAGDPLVPNAPNYAMQTGFRYHHSDMLQYDLTFGAEPALDERFQRTGHWEYTAQLGLRILLDVFTRDGKPGDPEGAPGLWPHVHHKTTTGPRQTKGHNELCGTAGA